MNFESVIVKIQQRVESVYNDMDSYFRNTISNYSNMICTVCNPNESPFFNVNDMS